MRKKTEIRKNSNNKQTKKQKGREMTILFLKVNISKFHNWLTSQKFHDAYVSGTFSTF